MVLACCEGVANIVLELAVQHCGRKRSNGGWFVVLALPGRVLELDFWRRWSSGSLMLMGARWLELQHAQRNCHEISGQCLHRRLLQCWHQCAFVVRFSQVWRFNGRMTQHFGVVVWNDSSHSIDWCVRMGHHRL